MMTVLEERKRCPACEAENSSSLLRAAYHEPRMQAFLVRKFRNPGEISALLAGADYELRKCRECTLIYQRFVLSEEYTALLYNDWLIRDDAEQELSRELLPPRQLAYFANEVLTIGRMIKKPHHQVRILDYGLGRGWWCRMAQAFGFDACGTDLATSLVTEARRKGINAIEVEKLAGRRFDFINTEQVFEHLSHPLAVLRQLRELLDDAGRIKISVPEGRGMERRIPLMDWTAPRWDRRYLLPATPLIHINTFTQRSIAAMAERAGLHPSPVPIRYEYSLFDTSSLKTIGRSLLRPLYRRTTGATYVFLQPS
jgi:SAM-dependent methyltransferase